MKAFVNKHSCIFCGLCGGICPDVFQSDHDGKSISLDIELSDELLIMARHAESICPTWSITIDDFPRNETDNAWV
ncbi:ferredoxin [Anaerosolibacter carboniphilus]|uniref:Ferredoxin n=1 Tax=Anaerosolibacter carboniphilus TaxID=1417629 RepID=A0A841KMH9_9FIRM|nr:ferredoxin [Anaerosolibacter carboniphilus]MBB6215004.1 ferredoxin [Anaerosolibacter carboniphilus]